MSGQGYCGEIPTIKSSMKNWACNEHWIINIENNIPYRHFIPLIIFNIVSSVVTAVLNSISLVAIWRLQSLEDGTRLILLNLCFADLLTGSVSQPLYTAFLSLQITGVTQCLIANVLSSISLGLASTSFHMLLVASTERYLSLFYPYWHQRIVNGFKPKAVALMVWIISLVNICLNNINMIKNWFFVTMMVVSGLELAWLSFIYVKIFHLACKVRKQVGHQQKGWPLDKNNKNSLLTIKNSFTGFLVMVSLICYIPYSVAMYYDTVCAHQIDQTLTNWLWTLVIANSFINPLCYYIKNKDIRKAVRKLIGVKHLCKGQHRTNVQPMNIH